MTADLYYKHSGKFSLGGVLRGLVIGGLVGLFAAPIYAYVILYNPIIIISALASAIFGGLVGFSTAAALGAGKVRNTVAAVAATFLMMLFAFYVSWAVWVYAWLRRAEQEISLLPLLLFPPVLLDIIQQINRVGAWTLRGTTVQGVVLWGVWAGEALLLFGVAFWALRDNLLRVPFCEGCLDWCKGSEGVARLAAANPSELKQRLEAKDLGYLEKLGPVPTDASAWLRLDFLTCRAGCQMTNTLTVHTVTAKSQKGEKPKEETKTVVRNLLLTADEAQTIRRLGERFTPSAPPPTSS